MKGMDKEMGNEIKQFQKDEQKKMYVRYQNKER